VDDEKPKAAQRQFDEFRYLHRLVAIRVAPYGSDWCDQFQFPEDFRAADVPCVNDMVAALKDSVVAMTDIYSI
jgi:hypothetical protein